MIETTGTTDGSSLIEIAPGSCAELVCGCGSLRSFVGKALGAKSNAQSSIHVASNVATLWSSDSSGASEHVHTHPRKLPKIAIGSTKARVLRSAARRIIIGKGLYMTFSYSEEHTAGYLSQTSNSPTSIRNSDSAPRAASCLLEPEMSFRLNTRHL